MNAMCHAPAGYAQSQLQSSMCAPSPTSYAAQPRTCQGSGFGAIHCPLTAVRVAPLPLAATVPVSCVGPLLVRRRRRCGRHRWRCRCCCTAAPLFGVISYCRCCCTAAMTARLPPSCVYAAPAARPPMLAVSVSFHLLLLLRRLVLLYNSQACILKGYWEWPRKDQQPCKLHPTQSANKETDAGQLQQQLLVDNNLHRDTAQHSTHQYRSVQYSTARYVEVQLRSVPYSSVQCSTAPFSSSSF